MFAVNVILMQLGEILAPYSPIPHPFKINVTSSQDMIICIADGDDYRHKKTVTDML